MKHLPIMLALALSISLTSYDGSTTKGSNNTDITEATSFIINTVDSDVLSEELTVNLEDKL